MATELVIPHGSPNQGNVADCLSGIDLAKSLNRSQSRISSDSEFKSLD